MLLDPSSTDGKKTLAMKIIFFVKSLRYQKNHQDWGSKPKPSTKISTLSDRELFGLKSLNDSKQARISDLSRFRGSPWKALSTRVPPGFK
jgi:hypothetical protein